jgi:hypothetical protein
MTDFVSRGLANAAEKYRAERTNDAQLVPKMR